LQTVNIEGLPIKVFNININYYTIIIFKINNAPSHRNSNMSQKSKNIGKRNFLFTAKAGNNLKSAEEFFHSLNYE